MIKAQVWIYHQNVHKQNTGL